jgi:hypothetical protein
MTVRVAQANGGYLPQLSEITAAGSLWTGRVGQPPHCALLVPLGLRRRLAGDQAAPQEPHLSAVTCVGA